jgi:predicted nuclease of predicted toxin-antitoxin system
VPAAVARVFESHGHEVIPFDDVTRRGAADLLVCRAAQVNHAVLVAFDKDMKRIARGLGVGMERFKRLNLIKFDCEKPMAAKRLELAMTFIEHEWLVSDEKTARRLYVVIGKHVLRTYR